MGWVDGTCQARESASRVLPQAAGGAMRQGCWIVEWVGGWGRQAACLHLSASSCRAAQQPSTKKASIHIPLTSMSLP